MKRNIFFAVLATALVIPSICVAQSEHKLYADGKSWVYEDYNRTTQQYSYGKVYVSSDTIVDGVPGKRLYSETITDPLIAYYASLSAYIDHEGKVYESAFSKIYPTYDFNVTTGDRVPAWDTDKSDKNPTDDEPDYYYDVIDDRIITLYGIERRMLTLQWDSERYGLVTFCWINGIGNHSLSGKRNIFAQTITQYEQFPTCCDIDRIEDNGAVECYEGVKLVYSRDDFANQVDLSFLDLAGVEQVNFNTDSANDSTTVYDLMGRVIKGKPSPGIYIIGGKKVYLR